MQIVKQIDEIENEFDIAIQSSLSMIKLGLDVENAFKRPIEILEDLVKITGEVDNSINKEIVLERIVSMINKFESKIEQIQ